MHIILAAGHDIDGDSGAVFGAEKESVDAAVQVDTAAHILATHSIPVTVVPHNLDYVDSVKWVNARYSGDSHLALEVHKNAGSKTARRIEVYYAIGDIADQKRASNLAGHLAKTTGLMSFAAPDTATRVKSLYWCRRTNVPALLVEMGFIEQPDNEVELGSQLARAILAYLGVTTTQPKEEEDMQWYNPGVTREAHEVGGLSTGKLNGKQGVVWAGIRAPKKKPIVVKLSIIPEVGSVTHEDIKLTNNRRQPIRLAEGLGGGFNVKVTSMTLDLDKPVKFYLDVQQHYV